MNPYQVGPTEDDHHRFDLLVDGQLSPAQRRQLLAALDDEPEGWRRCALAFLEAQALKEEFTAMLEPTRPQVVATQNLVRPRRGKSIWPVLAIAGSFLVALLLGTQLDHLWPGSATEGSAEVQLAGQPPTMPGPASQQPRVQENPQPTANAPSPYSGPVWVAEFSGPEEGLEPIRVPVVEQDHLDLEWLDRLPDPIPPDIVRQWEQIGHPVRQRRWLLPFRLEDGRRVIVPVDEVNIQYVGHPAL